MKIPELINKVFSLSFAKGMTMVVNFIASIIIAKSLTIRDYANYAQSFLVFDTLLPILTFGIPSVILYILPRIKEEEYRSVVFEILLILGLIAGSLSLFIILGGNFVLSEFYNNEYLASSLIVLSTYPLFTFPIILDKILVNRNKLKVNIIINTLYAFTTGIGLIILAITYKNPTYLIKYRLWASALFLPIYVLYSFKFFPNSKISISFKRLKKILIVGIPLGLATMFGTLTKQVGNLIVSSITTPNNFAIYSIGARELPFIGVVTGSVALVIMDKLSTQLSSNRLKEGLILFKKSITTSFAILLPLMVFFMFNAEKFIILLYGEKYRDSYSVFFIYLLYLPIRSIYFGSVFISAGRTKEILIRSIVSFVSTGLAVLVLTDIFGNVGAALGLILVSYFWATPYNLWGVKKIFKVSSIKQLLPAKEIMKISLLAGLSIFIILAIRSFTIENILIQFSLEAVFYFLVYTILTLKFNKGLLFFLRKIRS